MTHLDYLIHTKPKFPITIPSHKRPTGHLIKICKDLDLNPWIYIDDIDPKDEYDQFSSNVIQIPRCNIVEKRNYMVEHQLSLGNDFIWMFDDDYNHFETRDLNNKKMLLDFATFLSTHEQFITSKDAFCKIQTSGNYGIGISDMIKNAKFDHLYAISRNTLIASGFLLNIKLLEQHGIQFDVDIPDGCGEDIDMTAQICCEHHLPGKTIKFLAGDRDTKTKSIAWKNEAHNGTSKYVAANDEQHRTAYAFLRKKWCKKIGPIIHWHASMGASVSALSDKVVDRPDWYVDADPVKETQNLHFKFGVNI